jgi:hypothetical protein
VTVISESSFPASDVEDWTNDYPITDKYRNKLEDIVSRWRVTPLSAYDSKGRFIKIQELEVSLMGSLVLVYFELKHYAIKDKKTDRVGGNTFSAVATQVKILERAAERRASPYKSLMMKGPVVLPQSPNKRLDQMAATIAFHPGKDLTPAYIIHHSHPTSHHRSIWVQLQHNPPQ